MKILIAGGGPIGLTTGMLLARDGHDVTVLEKDAQPTPSTALDAWTDWTRTGVAQFRQAHLMLPRFRHVLETELPEVRDELVASGALAFSLLDAMAPGVLDRDRQPGDERFDTLTARRPVVEHAFATAGEQMPRVTVRRGVTVTEPMLGSPVRAGVPHVVGLRTDDGEYLTADLVVDAMGRRSRLPEWVSAANGRPVFEESVDAGFAYYTRHYRSRDGSRPEPRGPLGTDVATVRVVTLPADNNCWTIAVVAMAGDQPLKALRHNSVWERAVGAMPHAERWLEGEPIGDVIPMAGVLDRYRRMVDDDGPVMTGLVAVGDSWASTNPTAGRGLSLGLAHAVLLRDVVRTSPDNPALLVAEFDRQTEQQLTPWYRQQVDSDRMRAAVTQATIDGLPPAPPSDPAASARQSAFFAAAAIDPLVARAALDVFCCHALPQRAMAQAAVASRVAAFEGQPPAPVAGPSRAELLAALA